VMKSLGRYDDALTHLHRAAALYPRDRVVQNQIGRTLFLKRQYAEAIEAFQRVLAIDPEDLQAHYNLMLSYRGLGQDQLAEREETLYRRFKADESSQAITGPYRQLHPDDNNERQSIHEHVARGSAPGQTGARPGSDRGQTRVRAGSEQGQASARPGSEQGQTRARPASDPRRVGGAR
jgi:tetratricopeptide (TPR) repeat protein